MALALGRGAIGTLPSMGMIGAEYLQRRLPESWQSNWDGLAAANRWDAEIGNLLPPDPASKVSPLKDPSVLRNPKWWTSNVGETLPATLLPLGAAIKVGRMVKNLPSLARQLAIGGTVGGIAGPMEATQTYRQVIGEGGTEQEAARASEGMAVGAGILNAIGGTALLSPAAKTRLVNALIGAVVESTTETLEEPWEELMIAAVTGKQFEFDKVLERMAHVAPIAAVIGGPIASLPTPTVGEERSIKLAKNKIDKLARKYEIDSGELNFADEPILDRQGKQQPGKFNPVTKQIDVHLDTIYSCLLYTSDAADE